MPSNAVRLSAEPETGVSEILAEPIRVREYDERVGQRLAGGLRQLLEERVLLFRLAGYGLALATVLVFLVPARYEARTALMPPDSELGSGLASLLAMTAKTGNGLGMLAGDMLGLKTSGSLFIGILRSHTVEDRIIGTF